MSRRHDDPENFDPRSMRESFLYTLLKYGLSTFLVLYLLGVLSPMGLKPPYFDFKESLDAHERRMDERAFRSEDLMRGVCLGVWDGKPDKQNLFCNK
jgi:hypothetical protein